MVLGQNSLKIEGRFGNASLDFPNSLDVVYEVSCIIGKKEKIPTRLIRGKILYTRLPDVVAEYFLSLDNIKYERNDSVEVLYGDWTASGLIPMRDDGFAGSFWVMKLRMHDTLKKTIAEDTNLVYHVAETNVKEPDIVLIPAQMKKRKNTEDGHVTVNTKKITESNSFFNAKDLYRIGNSNQIIYCGFDKAAILKYEHGFVSFERKYAKDEKPVRKETATTVTSIHEASNDRRRGCVCAGTARSTRI